MIQRRSVFPSPIISDIQAFIGDDQKVYLGPFRSLEEKVCMKLLKEIGDACQKLGFPSQYHLTMNVNKIYLNVPIPWDPKTCPSGLIRLVDLDTRVFPQIQKWDDDAVTLIQILCYAALRTVFGIGKGCLRSVLITKDFNIFLGDCLIASYLDKKPKLPQFETLTEIIHFWIGDEKLAPLLQSIWESVLISSEDAQAWMQQFIQQLMQYNVSDRPSKEAFLRIFCTLVFMDSDPPSSTLSSSSSSSQFSSLNPFSSSQSSSSSSSSSKFPSSSSSSSSPLNPSSSQSSSSSSSQVSISNSNVENNKVNSLSNEKSVITTKISTVKKNDEEQNNLRKDLSHKSEKHHTKKSKDDKSEKTQQNEQSDDQSNKKKSKSKKQKDEEDNEAHDKKKEKKSKKMMEDTEEEEDDEEEEKKTKRKTTKRKKKEEESDSEKNIVKKKQTKKDINDDERETNIKKKKSTIKRKKNEISDDDDDEEEATNTKKHKKKNAYHRQEDDEDEEDDGEQQTSDKKNRAKKRKLEDEKKKTSTKQKNLNKNKRDGDEDETDSGKSSVKKQKKTDGIHPLRWQQLKSLLLLPDQIVTAKVSRVRFTVNKEKLLLPIEEKQQQEDEKQQQGKQQQEEEKANQEGKQQEEKQQEEGKQQEGKQQERKQQEGKQQEEKQQQEEEKANQEGEKQSFSSSSKNIYGSEIQKHLQKIRDGILNKNETTIGIPLLSLFSWYALEVPINKTESVFFRPLSILLDKISSFFVEFILEYVDISDEAGAQLVSHGAENIEQFTKNIPKEGVTNRLFRKIQVLIKLIKQLCTSTAQWHSDPVTLNFKCLDKEYLKSSLFKAHSVQFPLYLQKLWESHSQKRMMEREHLLQMLASPTLHASSSLRLYILQTVRYCCCSVPENQAFPPVLPTESYEFHPLYRLMQTLDIYQHFFDTKKTGITSDFTKSLILPCAFALLRVFPKCL